MSIVEWTKNTFEAEVPVLESVVGHSQLVASGSQKAEKDEEEKEEKDLHVRHLIHRRSLSNEKKTHFRKEKPDR